MSTVEETVESTIANQTLRDSGIGEATGVTVLAVRRVDGNFTQSPNADTKLYPGDVPIVLGTARQLENFEAWLNGG